MKAVKRKPDVNYFDLENISDLHEEVRKEVRGRKVLSEKTKNLLALFKIKSELTRNEVIVGMFRVHNTIVTKEWTYSSLVNLSKRGLLQKTGKGTFKTIIKN